MPEYISPVLEKILLMALSAIVSLIVGTWYGGRMVGEFASVNEQQNQRLARLEGMDMTSGAREQFAALKAHMAADDLQHQSFQIEINRLSQQQQTNMNAISVNSQRLTELERRRR